MHVLENLLALAERRRRRGRAMRWADLPAFAEVSVVVGATAACMDGLPADKDFGSFDELRFRRDETGVVRLR